MKTFVLLAVLLSPIAQANSLYDCSGQGIRAVVANQNGKLVLGVQDLITKKTLTKVAIAADPFAKSTSKTKVLAAYQGRTNTYAVQLVVYQAKASTSSDPWSGSGSLPTDPWTPGLPGDLPAPGNGFGEPAKISARLAYKNESAQRAYTLTCRSTSSGCLPSDPWCSSLPDPILPH